MIVSFLAFVFIFISTTGIRGCESRTVGYQKNEKWRIHCKDGLFASAIHTWYAEGKSGQKLPSGVRLTCSNPLDHKEIQQIQAFNTKTGPWQESRSCPIDEQIIGLNLWPSLDRGIPSRSDPEWNPQILCREQRQNSRLGRGRSVSSRQARCDEGHALCGIHGNMQEIDSNKVPSFKNYGINCCKLPKMPPKKVISVKPSSKKESKRKIPESRIFKLTLGPPGGAKVRQLPRKPKRKPSSPSSTQSKDFVLKLVINPNNDKIINIEPTKLDDEKPKYNDRVIPVKLTKNELDSVPIVERENVMTVPLITDDAKENSAEKNPLLVKEDENKLKGDRNLNFGIKIMHSEKDQSDQEELSDKKVSEFLENIENAVHPEARSVKHDTQLNDPTSKTKSSLFEEGTIFAEEEKPHRVAKIEIAPDSADDIQGRHIPFQVSKDELLDIEVITSGKSETTSSKEEVFENFQFTPVYLVKKKGKLYKRSKCLWPRSLPERQYQKALDADLEVTQVRSGRNLIPVLLIKVHEGYAAASRECFWPRVKSGRQIDGQSRLQPEWKVLTP